MGDKPTRERFFQHLLTAVFLFFAPFWALTNLPDGLQEELRRAFGNGVVFFALLPFFCFSAWWFSSPGR